MCILVNYLHINDNKFVFNYFQLSELEQRVIEAEERAEDAEDKVNQKILNLNRICLREKFFSSAKSRMFVRKFSFILCYEQLKSF